MCSVETLREFVNERLTAAAEEIFGVFTKTIVEYQEEIDRQRRLLDLVWKPQIKLHRIDLLQQHVCKEEILVDQQLCNQNQNSSVDQEDPDPPQVKEDQEDPDPPQVKEEQEELCSSQEEEQLELKLETDTFMLTPANEESDPSEPEPERDHSEPEPERDHSEPEPERDHIEPEPERDHIEPEPESDHSEPEPERDHSEPEPERDHQLLYNNPHVAESRDQKEVKHEDSGSTGNVEKKILQKSKSQTNKVSNRNLKRNTKKHVQCDTCGKDFKCMSSLNVHQRMHTGEKPYSCNTCGKRFSQTSMLKDHSRTHTGEKPYICQICGKGFGRGSNLKAHTRIHTGEKPFPCKICGKRFGYTSVLKTHLKIHTRGNLGGYGSGGRAGFPALRRLAIQPLAPAPSTACQSDLKSKIELQIAVSSACDVVSVQPLQSVYECV